MNTIKTKSPNDTTVDQLLLQSDRSLHGKDITEEAKNQFSYHAEILNTFEMCRRAIWENEQMTPMDKPGRHYSTIYSLAISMVEFHWLLLWLFVIFHLSRIQTRMNSNDEKRYDRRGYQHREKC